MGTNYYWYESGEPTCPHCKRETPSLHIGKLSSGWVFALRIHPTEGVNTLDDWESRWHRGAIVDEYGCVLTASEMLAVILGGSADSRKRHEATGFLDVKPGGETYDLCNYEFS